MALQPYDPSPEEQETVDWGVIILTGILALALAAGLGLLGWQVSAALNRGRQALLPDTPTPNIILTPAFVLKIAPQGRWESAVQVFLPGGEVRTYYLSGTGKTEAAYPVFDNPPGANVVMSMHFEVVLNYPIYAAGGGLGIKTFYPANYQNYRAALDKYYYITYDASPAPYLMTIEEGEAPVGGLPIQNWFAPPLAPFPTPGS